RGGVPRRAVAPDRGLRGCSVALPLLLYWLRRNVMAKGFSLEIDPWAYRAKYQEDGTWVEEYVEKPHLSPREEEALPAVERAELLLKRNNYAVLPIVNYTTQYGMGCFEGLKAFPQPDGSLALFRPDENGKRMEASMKGLLMPPFPASMFLTAVRSVVSRNRAI